MTLNNKTPFSKSIILPISIIGLWFPMLFCDSSYFAEHYFNGKTITTIAVIFITFYLLLVVPLRLKISMLLMIPLSWLGEYIFSDLLDMYHYRENTIPLYVPFGHAGVFTCGWLITQRSFAISKPQLFKKIFISFYIVAFTFVIFYLKDTLSLLMGIIFWWVLKKKNYLPFYLLMGVLVLYLELIGTFLEVWKWDHQQGIFNTVNPPLGAICLYVGGDALLGKLTRYMLRQRRKNKQKASIKTA